LWGVSGGLVLSSTAVAGYPGDGLSLIALRTRAVKYWLVGISLLTLGVTYVAPIAAALRMPGEQSYLPSISVPLVRVPTLAVPKLHAAPAQAALPKLNTGSHRAAPTHKRKLVNKRVPVLTDKYTQTPAASTATKKKAAKDPFANVPVVEDTVGAPPIIAPTTPAAAPAAAPAAPATDPVTVVAP
jgi:hypothetical protein